MALTSSARVKSVETDDPRHDLRQAIAGAAKAKATLASHEHAILRAEELIEDAREKHQAASKAMHAAREHEAQLAIAAASGGSASPATVAGSLRAARTAAEDSADELAAAEAGLAKLKTEIAGDADLVGLVDSEARASNEVIVAVNRLMGKQAAPLLEEGLKLRRRLMHLQQALFEMISCVEDGSSDIPRFSGVGAGLHLRTFATNDRHQAAGPIKGAVERFLSGPSSADQSAAAAFSSWRRNLRTHPDAPMPELPE